MNKKINPLKEFSFKEGKQIMDTLISSGELIILDENDSFDENEYKFIIFTFNSDNYPKKRLIFKPNISDFILSAMIPEVFLIDFYKIPEEAIDFTINYKDFIEEMD